MFMNKAEMTITNAIVIGQNSQAANPGSFDFSAGNLTFSGDISGSGATFVKNVDNTKTMTLSGNNSGFTGIWSASKGTLRFASPDTGSPNGTWIMGHNGAVLDFGGGTIHLGALSSSTEWAKILPAVNSGNYTIVVGEKNVDSTFTAQINQGTGNSIGLEKRGTAVQTLANAVSSYRGGTTVKGGILSAMIIADDWVNSSIGQTGSLVLDGGTLQYIGVGNSSNRRITLGLAGGGLDASGTGAIIMSNAGMTLTPGGARTLTLSGSSTSTNLLKTIVANDGANPTSLRKTGTGTWLLSADSTYTGATLVDEGELAVEGSLNAGSAVSVQDAGVLGGHGNVNGTVTATGGGSVMGGRNGGGTLTVKNLDIGAGGAIRLKTAADGACGVVKIPADGSLALQDFNLSFEPLDGYAPSAPGVRFGLVRNETSGPIDTSALQHQEGAIVYNSGDGMGLRVTYTGNITDTGVTLGGTGNDIVVYSVLVNEATMIIVR